MTLDDIMANICENLPFDFTLYENEGTCTIEAPRCQYCKKYQTDYLCHKKTYNLDIHTELRNL